MVPTPADIARYRHVAAAVVRGVGLLLLVYGATRLGVFVYGNFDAIVRQVGGGSGRGSGPFAQLSSLRRYVAAGSVPLVLAVAGLVAVWRPVWIARWLVPARVTPRCPGCGFHLAGLRSESCPECGMFLGAAFLDPRAAGRVKANATDSE
ncbi:MAG: hypothetical protein AAFR96_02735 [Planctomycetota bacterium]